MACRVVQGFALRLTPPASPNWRRRRVGYPDFFVPLATVALVLGTAVMVWTIVSGIYLAGPLRRSQRLYQPSQAR
jgi:hypothetical protein